MRRRLPLSIVVLVCSAVGLSAQQPAPAAPAPPTPPAGQAAQPSAAPAGLPPDANGNPRRLAVKTGHVSNYDESKVGTFTLPDPLAMADGTPVRDAKTWQARRRPEIVALYESAIFGKAPAATPAVRWQVTSTDPQFRSGKAVRTQVTGTAGDGAKAVTIRLNVYLPAGATTKVPVILLANFGGGPTPPPPPASGAAPVNPLGEPPVADDILSRGWGYATIQYQDIQPDRANTLTEGIIGLTLAPGTTAPAPGEWGAITAWAWGISRTIDYLSSNPAIDASADRAPWSFASRQGGALGLGARSAHRRVSTRAVPGRWAPRCRAATTERRSTTWRRTSPGGSRAATSSGPDGGRTCRSTRTC